MRSNKKILLEIELRTAQASKELRQFTRDVNIANAKINTAMAEVRKNGKPAGYSSKNSFLKEHSLKVAQNKELLAVESDRIKKIIESSKGEISALKKKVVSKKKSVSDLRRLTKAEFGSDFSKQVNAQYKSLDKAIPAMDRYRLATRMIKKQIASVGNAAKKARVPFAGWAMSIMFFGMALKRMFNTVWKSSTKSFQDVMHSVEGTTTSFDMLQGSTKYLGFTVGEALQPIAANLIPIVDKISDWVSKNPKLTAGIIKWVGILGTVFMAGGAGVLAINGFRELRSIITGVGVEAGATATKTSLAADESVAASNRMLSSLKAVGKAAAIAVSFYFAEKSIEDLVAGNYLDAAVNAMIAAGSYLMLTQPYLGGTLLAIGFTLKFIESGASSKLVSWFQKQLEVISSMWNDFVSRVKVFGIFHAGEAADRARSTFLTGGGLQSTLFDTPSSSSTTYNTYYIEGSEIHAGSVSEALDDYNQRLKMGILN